MKKIIAIITVFLLLFTLIPPALAAGAGTAVYANTSQIANNLAYTNTVSYINSTQRQQSYALSLTGQGDAYPIVMADDTIYGSMTIEQLVNYAASQGKNVLAAVNTDFFSMKTGVPMGMVVENGVYKSSPEGRPAVSFKPDGSVYFSDSSEVTITLTNNGSAADLTNSGKVVTLTHFNKYRMDTGGMYLFSSAFSTVSTRTSTPGWFVKFKILEGAPSVNGTMTLEVADLVQSSAAQTIGDGYLVLTAADQCGYSEEYTKFKIGDQVTLNTACTDPNLADSGWVTGGGDMLIKNGAITDSAQWDKSIAAKNPRTAFGVKADGTVISYVIDGRESDNSSGLTLQGLAEEMLQRGCVQAVNFDGGGSSAISIRLPGTAAPVVVNHPSDGSSRKCAEYLLFVTDKTSDGLVTHLNVNNDGPVVLAGSSVNLTYGASDGGYTPAAVPADVQVVSGGLGTVTGATYTAGPTHGVDTLTLTSPSTGATGVGTVHIINDPTNLTVTAGGSAVTALSVRAGDTVQLGASASYYGFPVVSDTSATVYTITGDIGTVSADGLLTVGNAVGATGAVNVQIGSKSVSIPVTVTGFADTVGHWAQDYITDLAKKGIVTGTTATTFEPDLSIHRGDFVLMLYRAAGQPAAGGPLSFTDVAPTDYYANAIAWAETSQIAQGDGSGLFKPQDTLTREQAFALIYRALPTLKIPYQDGTADLLDAFQDKAAVSAYAVTPAATLVSMGVVSGANGLLMPANGLSRGEMAKLLDVVLTKA
ncbi:S-layer homology domain-containing protein [Sporobacter termitidis DSM 10068]|uniref:S-layer homology domain-containing protein n=1 Tax=Sporobacter termitidis DSM 10068 TaxID=1123282 RepID=A0A1M5WXG6_9FIRM|nr:phosphodiester glycosidase family protein [Sporobacter termitidis]SHH92191.1 S-layer homology domain-containing protein [Sporobacter termitidis DSM 10068]